MRNVTREEMEASRPEISAGEAIDFCLRMLDKDNEPAMDDFVVSGLTFEELIGALLLARDSITAAQ